MILTSFKKKVSVKNLIKEDIAESTIILNIIFEIIIQNMRVKYFKPNIF